jgi:tetratricopeptide (TPR) repeat protein
MDYNFYTKIIYGKNQFNTYEEYYNEALNFEQQGNYKKSIELFQNAINHVLNENLPSNNHIAFLYNKIGLSAAKLEDYDKALMAFSKAIEIELLFNNVDESKVFYYYLNMAIIYKLKFDFINAIVNYKKCIEIKLKMVEEFHPDLFDLHFIIAACYESADKIDEAFYEFVYSAKIYHYNTFNITFGLDKKEAIYNAKRLAKQLNKENELPEWMKNF